MYYTSTVAECTWTEIGCIDPSSAGLYQAITGYLIVDSARDPRQVTGGGVRTTEYQIHAIPAAGVRYRLAHRESPFTFT